MQVRVKKMKTYSTTGSTLIRVSVRGMGSVTGRLRHVSLCKCVMPVHMPVDHWHCPAHTCMGTGSAIDAVDDLSE